MEVRDLKKGGMVRRVGSVTYRVNETPQKMPPQPSVKDYVEQVDMIQSSSHLVHILYFS